MPDRVVIEKTIRAYAAAWAARDREGWRDTFADLATQEDPVARDRDFANREGPRQPLSASECRRPVHLLSCSRWRFQIRGTRHPLNHSVLTSWSCTMRHVSRAI